MVRTLAAIVLVLGILAVGFSSASYFRLRQVALSAGPMALSDHLDSRVMTVGMRDQPGSDVIVAADFARHVQARICIVLGVGLTMLLSGGVLLLQTRTRRHERDGGHGPVGGGVSHA